MPHTRPRRNRTDQLRKPVGPGASRAHTPAEERVEDSAKERILAAAEELFADSGFDATPTSRIAERAGVPKGLVHYYFNRKRDLLEALVGRVAEGRLATER